MRDLTMDGEQMSQTTHVYPASDIAPHSLHGVGCACIPHLVSIAEGEYVVVHTAWDSRPVDRPVSRNN